MTNAGGGTSASVSNSGSSSSPCMRATAAWACR
jgi:hypothetical protein